MIHRSASALFFGVALAACGTTRPAPVVDASPTPAVTPSPASVVDASPVPVVELPPAPVVNPSASPLVDLAHADVVDLTYPFDEHTLYWPSSPSGFELKNLLHGDMGGFFYSANEFSAPEHGGTHVDAPSHFFEKGRSVEQIPVEQLIASAVVIDVAARTASDPDYRLSVDDVTAWESRNGAIPRGAIVLLRTGWGKRYGDRKSYFGSDRPSDTHHLHFPSFGAEAVRTLIAQRHIGAIGVDTASIDYGQSDDFIVHQIASSNGVPGLENVANLDRLPERGAWVIALPMKIGGGSGAPLRIVALVPR